MLILDALFALLLFKIWGIEALYVLAITACVSFLRLWGRMGFVAHVYRQYMIEELLKPKEEK